MKNLRVVPSSQHPKSLVRVFLILSFFFHSATFAYLYLISKPENQQTSPLHSVEIENPQKISKAKKPAQKIMTYKAEYGLGDPALKNGLDFLGSELGTGLPTATKESGVSLNKQPLGNKRESNTSGFETGLGAKAYSEIEFTEIKISKLLNISKKPWLLKRGQHEKIKQRVIEFLTGQAQVKTWYTLGLGSRTVDMEDQKEVIYYLRRLEHNINLSGTMEQDNNLQPLLKEIYEQLTPELKIYWDSLTNNYRVLNDHTRGPD